MCKPGQEFKFGLLMSNFQGNKSQYSSKSVTHSRYSDISRSYAKSEVVNANKDCASIK
jgi:hypothetical protein